MKMSRFPEMAQKLSEGTSARGSVEWKLGDFTALDLPSGAYQAAFSIEASCHAEGADKEAFVQECSRLLEPGAKLVVAELKFLAGELLLRRKKLNSVRWGHIVACLLAPWIGLGRRYFGYYLVTAQKR